ncbi:hypothetical protein HW132_34460 [Brasilonema sp. CT11]|nr:hypothetical protein [Brasilonema sp. CT11]
MYMIALHELLIDLASKAFYDEKSTTKVRANALSVLLVTTLPIIPSFLDRVVEYV